MTREEELDKLADHIMGLWPPVEKGAAYDEVKTALKKRIEAFASRSDPPTRYPEGSFDLE